MRWNDYNDIIFTKGGREYRGRYRTSKGKFPMVEVSYGWGSKAAVIHSSPPEQLARLMVLELAAEQESAESK